MEISLKISVIEILELMRPVTEIPKKPPFYPWAAVHGDWRKN
jgi:hypothetical protein